MSRQINPQLSDITPAGQLCRVCLRCSKLYLSLFSPLRELQIYEHINNIVDVKIRDSDGYPDVICQACLDDLQVTIDFKERCLKSNLALINVVTPVIEDICKQEGETHEVKLENSPIKEEALYQDFNTEVYDNDVFFSHLSIRVMIFDRAAQVKASGAAPFSFCAKPPTNQQQAESRKPVSLASAAESDARIEHGG
ncbi:unnamed protein product [Plutella xylostella]|uniref:(diamondback moth) hypothetical protein n=1 Tax=Plutella xylostella TaxID=51655 RepID=A0A8S4E1P1_PLUXY|nr:unnamed protein product [Plutella xylostella]